MGEREGAARRMTRPMVPSTQSRLAGKATAGPKEALTCAARGARGTLLRGGLAGRHTAACGGAVSGPRLEARVGDEGPRVEAPAAVREVAHAEEVRGCGGRTGGRTGGRG